MVKHGDLVQTEDGYYGIVVGERDVLLGNGCQEIMDDEAWSKLQVLPINVFHEGAVSNFDILVDGRAPCQEIRRQEAHMRAELDDVFER